MQSGIQQSAIQGLFRTPFSGKDGKISLPWIKWLQEQELKTRNALTLIGQLSDQVKLQGRSGALLGIVQNLNDDGTVNSLDNVHEGVTFGKTEQLALTAGKVDLSKTGVVGQVTQAKIGDNAVGSPQIVQNVMSNYSNNATVDSIDNGVNATIQVYGPGGVGTSWHQFIGNGTGPEIPAFSGAAAYNSDFNVYYDGAYHISANGFDTLPDGILFSGALHTVSAGGTGGTGGGGGSGGGGGGGGMQRK